jgi:hypothetical protein
MFYCVHAFFDGYRVITPQLNAAQPAQIGRKSTKILLNDQKKD